jgi:hypothetical protein
VPAGRKSTSSPARVLLPPTQAQQHPGVAERVGLHPREVEELGDAFVGRLQQLGGDRRVHRHVRHDLEPVPGEELGLEGQAEHPADPEVAGCLQQSGEQRAADPPAVMRRGDGEGAHLSEVLPHHVQRTARDDLPVVLHDVELLHVLVEHDRGLREEPAVAGVGVDQRPDGVHVRGPRPTYLHRPDASVWP